MKNSTTPVNKAQQSTVVQWYDKATDRWVKFDRTSGMVLSHKVTPGEYKNINIIKRRPVTKQPRTESPSTHLASTPPAEQKVKKPKKVNYLNNKDLMIEVKKSKERNPPQMTDKLAHMLMMLVERYSKKSNWVGYSYNDDMRAFALMMLVRTWKSFNPDKGSNPFAFFTQCIKNSFIQFLKTERKQRDIRDVLYVDVGLDPSYTFQEKYATDQAAASEERRNSDDIPDTINTTDDNILVEE